MNKQYELVVKGINNYPDKITVTVALEIGGYRGFCLAWQKCVSCFSGEGYPTSVRNGKWRLIYSGEGCMGKGGGKAHTPREAKDNLKSTQMMSVIDAIGEGPVEGPVKGLQSILVNKTPLTDTDGNPVIHGVTAVWRAGEQEQTPPEGFESSGAETVLGVEVTKAKPVTRTITSPEQHTAAG